MNIKQAIARDYGDVQFLRVDGKFMTRTQLNNAAALLVDIRFITQRLHRLPLNGLKARLDIVRFYCAFQRSKLFRQLTGFHHQRIGSKISVQLIRFSKL